MLYVCLKFIDVSRRSQAALVISRSLVFYSKSRLNRQNNGDSFGVPQGRSMPKKVKGKRAQAGAQAKVINTSSQAAARPSEHAQEAVSVAKDGRIVIRVQAKPGAKQSLITDVSAEAVGIQIGAPPKDGEANEELVQYLASVLGIRKNSISLDKGSKSRQKTVKIDEVTGLTVEDVRQSLERDASGSR